jgi:uncharacterized membrane protein (UPF0127 family)
MNIHSLAINGELLNFQTRMGKLPFNDFLTLSVEIADSTATRSVGLSNRSEPHGDGMLFVYQYDNDHPFTVAAMKFDLDIFFFDAAGSLVAFKQTVAGDTSPVLSPRPYRYVLETKRGHLAWEDRFERLDFTALAE